MTDFHQALDVAVEEDLLPLSALLHQHGVVHRIYEEGGRQRVTVRQPQHVQEVRKLYDAWQSGRVNIELTRQTPPRSPVATAQQWRMAPVTLTLIALSFCGFLLIYLPAPIAWVNSLSFTPFRIDGNQVLLDQFNGQYWRLVTPAFLHFSWLHIVFNCLWLWDIGGRVERVMGHFNMFMLFVVIAAISNTSQFVYGGGGLFGGMSGVVYGFLGFAWVAPLLQPTWRIQPTRSIMLLMVGWLVACMLGLVEVLGFGAIANAAHLGGLLCGAALGALFGGISRLTGDRA